MQGTTVFPTTTTGSGGFRFFKVLLVLAFLALAGWTLLRLLPVDPEDESRWTDFEEVVLVTNVIVDPNYSHADERHPKEAPLVRRCLDQRGPYMNFLVDRALQRYLRVCIGDGWVGFQIVDKIKGKFFERTAYFRSGMKTIQDLNRYIRNSTYTRYKGLIQ
jgi:hypothetical protein